LPRDEAKENGVLTIEWGGNGLKNQVQILSGGNSGMERNEEYVKKQCEEKKILNNRQPNKGRGQGIEEAISRVLTKSPCIRGRNS